MMKNLLYLLAGIAVGILAFGTYDYFHEKELATANARIVTSLSAQVHATADTMSAKIVSLQTQNAALSRSVAAAQSVARRSSVTVDSLDRVIASIPLDSLRPQLTATRAENVVLKSTVAVLSVALDTARVQAVRDSVALDSLSTLPPTLVQRADTLGEASLQTGKAEGQVTGRGRLVLGVLAGLLLGLLAGH